MITIDDTLVNVTRRQLAAFAASVPQPPKPNPNKPFEKFDVGKFIARHLAQFGPSDPAPYDGSGSRWVLRECPFTEGGHSHKGTAVIIQFASGAIAASCRSDSCSGRKWAELRERYDPAALRQPAKLRSIEGGRAPAAKPEKEKPKPTRGGPNSAAGPPPFRWLGFSNGAYYFFAHEKRDVQALSTSAMSRPTNLFALAPRDWWQAAFPTESPRNDWIDVNRVANFLVAECHKVGRYHDVNGALRGMWLDQGRRVFHGGDYLLVDGARTQLDGIKDSNRFYRLDDYHVPLNYDHPLSDTEAAEILDISREFLWRDPLSAYFLAGWLALAPACGALRWRPHVWLVGSGGSGKSEILNLFIKPLLMNGLFAKSTTNTSEAGMRQEIAQAAIPFIYDEAEPGRGGSRASDQLNAVLHLIRSTSSEGSSAQRGTVGGSPQEFPVSSTFLLSSIITGLTQPADESRFAKLELRKAGTVDQWRPLKARIRALATPETAARLFARIYRNLDHLVANVEVFEAAVSRIISVQRAGQQYGALLAGAAALVSSERWSEDEAVAWLRNMDGAGMAFALENYTNVHEDETDRLIARINAHTINVLTESNAHDTISVGELIPAARRFHHDVAGKSSELDVTYREAYTKLMRAGIAVLEDEGVVVATGQHAELERMLRDTEFAHNWKEVLRRLPGAYTSDPIGPWRGHRGVCVAVWDDENVT